MVAGKVKAAMGFQRSPATPKTSPPPAPASTPRRSSASPASNTKSSAGGGGGTVFSRSFGVYFPRASAQVQPRPPDLAVADLLRVVEDLRERESRLRTQLLEQKILKETVAVVPFLESELAAKTAALDLSDQAISSMRGQIDALEAKIRERDGRIKEMAAEIDELRRSAAESRRVEAADECSSSQRFQGLIDASARSNLLKNLRRGPKSADVGPIPEAAKPAAESGEKEAEIERPKDEFERPRAPRVPKPPPLPSSTCSSSSSTASSCSSSESAETAGTGNRAPDLSGLPPIPPPPPASGARAPPPPPPPPPRGAKKSAAASVRRVPEVVEFYHSLMRRDSRRESGGSSGAADSTAGAAGATRDMIGEIENRSAHLLAIKTDVETQGDFIRFLIKQVNGAAFAQIEDLVAFVKWLDDELSYLVDERAVLKHFDWPEQKADAMREAAFGYCDLKKLESEASSFRDDPRQHCSAALKKMQALLEKLEHGAYDLSRVRDGAAKRYKGFQIPWEWMLDTGFVSQIKLASVKLAMKYMKRVSSELEAMAGGAEEEELMLQGVRFAFRVHQFAGGFDVETMRAFQELRDKVRSLRSQHQEQKLLSRSISMSC